VRILIALLIASVLGGCAITGVEFSVESNIPGVAPAVARAQAAAASAACGKRVTEAGKSASLSVGPRELPGMYREQIGVRYDCP
jgi:hypothetical protein